MQLVRPKMIQRPVLVAFLPHLVQKAVRLSAPLRGLLIITARTAGRAVSNQDPVDSLLRHRGHLPKQTQPLFLSEGRPVLMPSKVQHVLERRRRSYHRKPCSFLIEKALWGSSLTGLKGNCRARDPCPRGQHGLLHATNGSHRQLLIGGVANAGSHHLRRGAMSLALL